MDRNTFSEQFQRNEQEIYDWQEFERKVRNPSLREPRTGDLSPTTTGSRVRARGTPGDITGGRDPRWSRPSDEEVSSRARLAAQRMSGHHVAVGLNTSSIYDFGPEHGYQSAQRMVDRFDFGEPVAVYPIDEAMGIRETANPVYD